MLILVGTNNKIIKKGNFKHTICPNCREVSAFDYIVFSKYAHLTYIPLFPVGKDAVVICENCDETIDINDFDDTTLSKLAQENNNLKNPVWMYFGSFALVIASIYGIYIYFNSGKKTDLYFKKPMLSDVYCLKNSKGFYYTIKIDSLTKDSVYATENDFQVNLPNEIDEINQPENYTTIKVKYSKNDLLKLYNDNKISSIIRN